MCSLACSYCLACLACSSLGLLLLDPIHLGDHGRFDEGPELEVERPSTPIPDEGPETIEDGER